MLAQSSARTGLPLSVLGAYGSVGLPLAAMTLAVFVYLPTFYTASLGLGLTEVGLILLLTRAWDMVTDPAAGWLSDHYPIGGRRRRPYVLIALPVLAVSLYALFVPPAGAGVTYLLGWGLLFFLAVSLTLLPLSAWGAELSPHYHERSRVFGARNLFVILGTLVALVLPVAFGVADAGQEGEALKVVVWFVLLSLPVAIVLLVAVVPERRYTTPPKAQGVRALFGLLADNRPFRVLIGAFLLNGLGNALPATLFLLYVGHVIARPDWAGPMLLAYFATGVAGVPLWVWLARRYEKHRVWRGAMLWACAMFAVVPFLGAGDVWPFLAVAVLTGATLGADLTLPAAMQADVIDHDTYRTRQPRAGLYFALWGMATKLAAGAAVGIAFPLLDLAGFQATGTNSAFALGVLALLYGVAPAVCKLAAIGVMSRYELTRDRHDEIRAALALRAAE